MSLDEIRKVILVIIDALRVDRVNAEVMPFLDEISRRGMVFGNAFITINATDPALTSIYSDRYPFSTALLIMVRRSLMKR